MDADSAPSLDPQIFQANMAALRQADPGLASGVERVAPHLAGAELTFARDGTLNFRIVDDQGRCSWFGRSSIPGTRAEILLEKFEVGLANVLLPGIGQGQEITLLLHRLSQHRAVFVWETDLAAVALTLRLHDWAEAIAAGRCVFLVCPLDQLAATLVAWLDVHPGHLCPERIMMWPWSAMQELAACRAAVQAAYVEIERRRATALTRETREYSPGTMDSLASTERAFSAGPLPIFALQVRDDLHLLADALIAASSVAGVAAAAIVVKGPGNVHPLARLRNLRRSFATSPPGALLLDCTKSQLKEVIPARTPALVWLGPAAHPLPALVGGVGEGDLLIAASIRVRERILAAGWGRPAPPVIPYPCLVASDAFADPDSERPIDVLLVADASSTAPEPYGFHLDTHAQLWRAASELIKARIETFTEDETSSILERVEKKLRFHLDEECVRRAMQDALGSVLANTLAGAFLAQIMSESKVGLRILGQGWGSTTWSDWAEKPSGLRDYCRAFARAKLAVFCDVTGEGSMLALMAAACGAVVVWRDHPLDTKSGGLATLLDRGKEMVCFHHGRDLVTAARRLLASTGERLSIAAAAQAKCKAAHVPERRLQALQTAASSYVGGCNEQL